MGALARLQKVARDTLQPYDLIIALGGDPLRMSVYSETDPLPDGLAIVQGLLQRVALEARLRHDEHEAGVRRP